MTFSAKKIGGLRIKRVNVPEARDEPVEWHPKDDLPDILPSEDTLRTSRRQIFSYGSINLTQESAEEDVLNPRDRPEHHDLIARATVYVLNMIVMVMALPVGLALLFFNIVGGENLRTTAHVIALTGMGLALAGTTEGARLLALVPGGLTL